MNNRFGKLTSAADMVALVKEIGFLPMLSMGVEGFSVEDMTRGQWWTGKDDDPWGWREYTAKSGEVVYAKIFAAHAGFVSLDWFPRLANYRRNGYDFDSRWEEGLATPKCRDIMTVVENTDKVMTNELKRAVGEKGFAGALSLLQMQTYLVIRGFNRRIDRFGKPYGWNIGEYATSENAFGADWVTSMYSEDPNDSREIILKHARSLFPDADEKALAHVFDIN